jgi:hypothetical protein
VALGKESIMNESLKLKLMAKGSQLMQSEAARKLMESEKFGAVMEKAMTVPFKVSNAVNSGKERLVALLDLATQEDVDDVKRTMARMEGLLKEIKKESADLLNKANESGVKRSAIGKD